MKIRLIDYDNRFIMVSIDIDGITQLRRIDMKDFPLNLLGMFDAMDDETRALADKTMLIK